MILGCQHTDGNCAQGRGAMFIPLMFDIIAKIIE